jgi:hypothetical protein
VVQIVRSDAGDELEIRDGAPGHGPAEVFPRQFADSFIEKAVCPVQQRNIILPELRFARIGTVEPVGALERKGPFTRSREPAPDRVFPVRGVQDELPDVVPIGARSPGGYR